MKKTKEVFVDGEVLQLKKDFLGWHIVNPIKEYGKINWKNLIAGGSWIKLLMVVIFVIICVGAIFEVSDVYRIANDCLINDTLINKLPNYPNFVLP